MNFSKQDLKNKLDRIESLHGISEHDIESKLKDIHKSDANNMFFKELEYEILAFSFKENFDSLEPGWGTYFGPFAILATGDGNQIEIPSFQDVNKDAIDYWNYRCSVSNNSLMKARYAGLVWDLSEKVVGVKPNYTVAVAYCQALLQVAKEKICRHPTHIIDKLKRALDVASSLNKKALILAIKDEIINYERHVANDTEPGLWGFSFDLLIGNKKVELSDQEERGIIEALESRLIRLSESSPSICEHAAERLARYYRSKRLEKECSRVIRALGQSYECAATIVDPLVATHWLEHMYEIYMQFNLKDDADELAKRLQDLGPKVRESFRELRFESKISNQDLELYIQQMLDGDLEQVLTRISRHYIPKYEETQNQVYDIRSQYPLSFLFERRLTDEQGRTLAKLGSFDEDMEGHIVSQIVRNMTVSSFLIGKVLNGMSEKFGHHVDKLLDYLFLSPIFSGTQSRSLAKGIQAYIELDYTISIHLLVPQIEAAVRNFVRLSGGSTMKSNRNGGFNFRTLDELLRSEQASNILGKDRVLYCRLVLTDQRGWNIRNRVCHGISQEDEFSRVVAERLIHVLLVLAQLRQKLDE